eukprot:TRINITY_DN977_c1_g1_i3.p1 TRINITY_DN977_c1_g1~~TRINITY_DN977_c1_g1_i3.p1  ORF type:complete len:506 (-),score=109.91 TRINITY_DN977_c1_g1_i3:761-2278(-)
MLSGWIARQSRLGSILSSEKYNQSSLLCSKANVIQRNNFSSSLLFKSLHNHDTNNQSLLAKNLNTKIQCSSSSFRWNERNHVMDIKLISSSYQRSFSSEKEDEKKENEEQITKEEGEKEEERNIAQYYGYDSMEEMRNSPEAITIYEKIKNDREIIRWMWKRLGIGLIVSIALLVFLYDYLFWEFDMGRDLYKDPFAVRVRNETKSYTLFNRSLKTFRTALSIVWDYKLNTLEENDANYSKVKSEIHQRSAEKILALCNNLGGFYTQIGQLIASSNKLPKEYSKAFYFFQDNSLPMGEYELRKTFLNLYGYHIDSVFTAFKYKPVSNTSMYQVHHGLLADKPIIFKIQYPEIKEQIKRDLRDINFIVHHVKRFFPNFDDMGLLDEINKCAKIQTDYLLQGSNARFLSDMFESDNRVKIPKQYRRYSKDQSLVVEFCKGFRLSETDGITALGFSSNQVQNLLKIIPSKTQKTPDPNKILIWKDFKTNKPIVVCLDFEFCSEDSKQP